MTFMQLVKPRNSNAQCAQRFFILIVPYINIKYKHIALNIPVISVRKISVAPHT